MNIQRGIKEEDVKELIRIAKKAFGYTNPEAYELFLAYQREALVLKSKNKVLGYSLIIPISEALKEKIQNNQISEEHLLKEAQYERAKEWWYVIDICVDRDESESRDALSLMIQSKSKIKGKKVCSVVVSEEGAIFAKFIKMTPKNIITKGFQGIKGYRPTFFQT